MNYEKGKFSRDFKIIALVLLQAMLVSQAVFADIDCQTLSPVISMDSRFLQKTFSPSLPEQLLLRAIGLHVIADMDYARKRPKVSFGVRYEKRKWLWELIQNNDQEKLKFIVKQANLNGSITAKEKTVLLYAIRNKAVTPEDLDALLAKTPGFKSAQSVSRCLLGRSEQGHGTLGAYKIITEHLKKNKSEANDLLREEIRIILGQVIAHNILKFIRLYNSSQTNALFDRISAEWNGRGKAFPKFKHNIVYYVKHPNMEIDYMARVLGLSVKGLEQQVRRAHKQILNTATTLNLDAGIIQSILQDVDAAGSALKYIADAKKNLKGLESILKTVVAQIGKDNLQLKELTLAQLQELVVLRLVHLKTYKELGKNFSLSEVTINRFFEGRIKDKKKTYKEGAITKLKTFMEKEIYPLERRIRNLHANVQQRSLKTIQNHLSKIISELENVYPGKDKRACFREMAVVLGSDSLRYYIDNNHSLDLIRDKLKKFYSEKRQGLREKVLLEIDQIYQAEPGLRFADNDKIEKTLNAKSRYVKEFGLSIFSDLFPELRQKALSLSQQMIRGDNYTQYLLNNYERRTPEAFRTALKKITRYYWDINPQWRGDYIRVYKYVATSLGYNSLAVFLEQNPSGEKARDIMCLFLTEKVLEFRSIVISDLIDTIHRFPSILNGDDKEVKAILLSQSKYARDFNISIYEELFPDDFIKTGSFASAISQIGQIGIRDLMIAELYNIEKDISNMFSTKERLLDILKINSEFFPLLGIAGYKNFFPECCDDEMSFFAGMWAELKAYKQEQKNKENKFLNLFLEIPIESLVEMSI